VSCGPGQTPRDRFINGTENETETIHSAVLGEGMCVASLVVS